MADPSVIQAASLALWRASLAKSPWSLADCWRAAVWLLGSPIAADDQIEIGSPAEVLRRLDLTELAGLDMQACSVDRTVAVHRSYLSQDIPIAVAITAGYPGVEWIKEPSQTIPSKGGDLTIHRSAVLVLTGWDDAQQSFLCRFMDEPNFDEEGVFPIPYTYAIDPNLSHEHVAITRIWSQTWSEHVKTSP